MSAHLEEDLASPVGYYPGVIGDTLDNGRWKIVRKLGWGPQSSTWLAEDNRDSDGYKAIKIYTVDATTLPGAVNELEILQNFKERELWLPNIPSMCGHFHEETSRGKHLCLVLSVLGASLDTFRAENVNGAYLPLHNVKKIIGDVADVLSDLHENNIIHGAITPGNVLLHAPRGAQYIEGYLSKHPTASPSADGIIQSQPLSLNDFKWNASAALLANECTYLSNFKYARYTSEASGNSPVPSPESLSGKPITKKTDIWMVGYTAYVLLTGKVPFDEHITSEELQRFIENIPSALPITLATIDNFPVEDIPTTVDFMTECLKSNPEDRPSAYDLLGIKWVKERVICSCGASG